MALLINGEEDQLTDDVSRLKCLTPFLYYLSFKISSGERWVIPLKLKKRGMVFLQKKQQTDYRVFS